MSTATAPTLRLLDNHTLIPAEMRVRPQWVVWRRIKRKGNFTKVPFQSTLPMAEAKSIDPSTWSSYDEAIVAVSDPSNRLDGIGFVFSPDDPYAGVDFDNCLDENGKVLKWARPHLDGLIGYAEVSPSGRGVKVFTRGSVPDGKGRKLLSQGDDKTGVIEVYDRGRYFTVTGNVFESRAAIGDGADQLSALHSQWFPPKKKPARSEPTSRPSMQLGDAELIAKARASTTKGAKFSSLFEGSIEGHPSKSEADLALCNHLAFWFGGDINAIDRMFRQSGLCDAKWTEREDYRAMTIDKAMEGRTDKDFYDPNYRSYGNVTIGKCSVLGMDAKGNPVNGSQNGHHEANGQAVPPPPGGGEVAGDEDEKPDKLPVEVNTIRWKVVEDSLEALKKDPNVFKRGNNLVSVVQEDSSVLQLTTRTTMEGVEGSPRIIILADSVIGTRLTKVADFFCWKKDKSGEFISIPCHPPDWLIKTISNLKHWPGVPLLAAVAECPFPRPDGSIVEKPGYDPETCILYAPSINFPSIPSNPSKDDAKECWERIRKYIRHFPFASNEDEVVFLAGLLGVVARQGIIGPMPGIAVSGNKAGIGKGFLVDGMVIPGTGRIAPISKYPHDSIEAGKVKTSIIRSGKTVVHFDNLYEGAKYGGEDIDSLITARITDDRVLGVSDQTGDLVARLCVFVNGNNIESHKDAYRRWLVINLVTDLEHPERRKILDDDGNPEKDLDAQMLENRADIVRDALTILRAHSQASWPNPGWAPLGSFSHWDHVVRGAVWFATGFDCTATQAAAAEDSDDVRSKVGLLQGIWELPNGKTEERGVTASEMVSLVEKNPDEYETLRQALVERGYKGKLADTRTLGRVLKSMLNTPIAGLKLSKHPTLKHQAVAWMVSNVEPESGESGESGESVFSDPTRDFTSKNDMSMNGHCKKSYRGFSGINSPDSPDSPSLSKIRAEVAGWAIEKRERYNALANRLLEDGLTNPADEIEAYRQINEAEQKEHEAAAGGLSGWD